MVDVDPQIIAITPAYIVVDKPQGLSVDMGNSSMPSLSKWLVNQLQIKKERIDKWGVHPVHFIDRSVGGLVLYARKKTVFVRLQKQFNNRMVKKIYHAQTARPLPKIKQRITLFHKRSADGKRALIYSVQNTDCKPVDLRYQVLENGWYEVRLGSGKFHQIRAMLAFLDAPIIGDFLYNGDGTPPAAIQLFAKQLSFVDPKTDERVIYESRMIP